MSHAVLLSQLPMFQDVPRGDLHKLVSMTQPTQFDKDALVMKQGEPANMALLLVEGRLRSYVLAGGTLRPLGSIRPGEIIGEEALFDDRTPRSSTVLAVTHSECLLFNVDLLLSGGDNRAVIAVERHMLRVMSRRIQRTNKNIKQAWQEAHRAQGEGAEGPTLRDRLHGLFRGGK